MKRASFLVFALAAGMACAQTNAPDSNTASVAPANPKPVTSASPKPAAPKKTRSQQTAAQLQAAMDQLTQSNRDLLDLLKKQQAVLEDMQFDRRLQSRQIESLEVRLSDTLTENADLKKQVAALEAVQSLHATTPATIESPGRANAPTSPPVAPADTNRAVAVADVPASTNAAPGQSADNPPPPPATYLPPPDSEGAPGTKSWHRLFTLKGEDSQQTDLFHIDGRSWRVLWHNEDKPGKVYVNTSALFINAFPRDDTIPQKVCAKLGSGGDKTELQGPGNYYLKVEASGGSWELAVEDFR